MMHGQKNIKLWFTSSLHVNNGIAARYVTVAFFGIHHDYSFGIYIYRNITHIKMYTRKIMLKFTKV